MNIKLKITKNVIFLTLSRLIGVLLAFFLFPFFIKHLGVARYGIYLLIVSFTGYFSLLELGMGTSLLRFVAEYQAKQDNKKLNELINTIFFFYGGIGILTFFGFLVLGLFLLPLFKISSNYIFEAKMLTLILAFSSLFSWPLGIFSNVLGGLQRYDLSAIVSFVVAISTTVLGVVAVLLGYGIVGLALTMILSSLLGHLLAFFLTKKIIPSLTIRPNWFSLANLKSVINFSFILFICQVSTVLVFEIDKVILGIFVSTAAITFYEAAAKIHQFIRMLENLVGTPFIPVASELETAKQQEKLREVVITGSKFVLAIILPTTLIFIILAKPFLVYWVGHDFAQVALVSQVFTLFWLINGNADIVTAALIGIGKVKQLLIFSILISITNVILSIILVQKLAILGVVLGTTIPFLLGTPIFVIIALKTLNIKLRDYFSKVVIKTYPLLLPLFAFLFFINKMHNPRNLFEVGVYAVAASMVYFALFFILGLETNEKKFFIAIVCQIKDSHKLLSKH